MNMRNGGRVLASGLLGLAFPLIYPELILLAVAEYPAIITL